MFCIDSLPFSGGYSREYENTWRNALYLDNAEEAFELQASSSDITTALYGLVGLKIINSHEFEPCAKRLKTIDVDVKFGYSMKNNGLSRVSDVVDHIIEKDLKRPI